MYESNVGGSRRRGRSPKGCMKGVKDTVEKRGMTAKNANMVCQNRSEWRAIVYGGWIFLRRSLMVGSKINISKVSSLHPTTQVSRRKGLVGKIRAGASMSLGSSSQCSVENRIHCIPPHHNRGETQPQND